MPYKVPLKKLQVNLVQRERINNLALIDHYQPIFNDAEDMAFRYIFNALPLWYMFMQYHHGQIVTPTEALLQQYGLDLRKLKYQKSILLEQGYIALTQFSNVFCVSDMPFCEPPLLEYERTILTKQELSQENLQGVEAWDKRKNFFFIRKKERRVDDESKAYLDHYVKHFDDTFKPALADLQEYCWLYSWCLRCFTTIKNHSQEHFLSGDFFLKQYGISFHDTRKAIHMLNSKGYLPHNSDKNAYIFYEKISPPDTG